MKSVLASISSHESPPQDCSDILRNNSDSESGMYPINVGDDRTIRMVDVWCDMDTEGGGWTVFHRRINGEVDFYRSYQSYCEGFGYPFNEFWLGNENLHHITSRRNYELQVDLKDFEDNSRYARYSSFHIASACDGYRMHVTGYSGDAGDSMYAHDTLRFSTYDRDQDADNERNCAVLREGAWWYNACAHSNLNGRYQQGTTPQENGVYWYHWRGSYYSLKSTEMKLRPALLTCPLHK